MGTADPLVKEIQFHDFKIYYQVNTSAFPKFFSSTVY